tara:strand:- start:574 stop:1257 length:684 start_codon:yes stop_codon:yes gene_type:complete
MATTLPGSPYVESSDLVAGYPGVSETLAERVDTVGVLPFADSTARGTALPSPTDGQYSYLQDTNSTEYWDGAAWVAAGGGGKILQVLSTFKADSFSTSSTSFVDVTGLSVSITPSAATSKIFVIATLQGSNSGQSYTRFNLVRDTTSISQGTAGSTYNQTFQTQNQVDNAATVTQGSVAFLDSPATASAVTYKIQMAASAGIAYVGRRGADTTVGVASNITVMEVGA